MPPGALNNQITVFRVWRWNLSLNMVIPEVALQINQFSLIIQVAYNVPYDDFVLVVAIEAAIIHFVNIHYAHIMASLDFVVDRNDFLPITPPMILCIIICGLNFKNRCFAVWQFDEVVNVRQHIGVDRMIKHLLHLIDPKACFHMENFSYQILKQMTDLFCHPVAFAVFIRYDL